MNTQQGCSEKRAALLLIVEQGDPSAGARQAIGTALRAQPGHASTRAGLEPARAEPAPVCPHQQHT